MTTRLKYSTQIINMFTFGKFYEVRVRGERTRIFFDEIKALKSANGFTNRGKIATVYECREVKV